MSYLIYKPLLNRNAFIKSQILTIKRFNLKQTNKIKILGFKINSVKMELRNLFCFAL